MTKDRAKKAAARERARATGERYVVARRAIEHPPERVDIHGSLLHRMTHRVPGVPEHVDGGLASRQHHPHRGRPRRERPSARLTPRHGEPRVLIAWQHRISRLVRAE